MLYELYDCSASCSRRGLLLGAMAAIGAVTIVDTAPSSATAETKISEGAVAYQDHPNGDKECSKCAQFQAPSSCKLVAGTISPRGYCRIFTPIRPAAARSRGSPFTV